MNGKFPIATEILKQLGGNQFRMMTGANDFLADEKSRSLQFMIGEGATNDINKVKIELKANDTYTMSFYYIPDLETAMDMTIDELKKHYEPIKVVSDVYVENLQATFTEETGFYTKL